MEQTLRNIENPTFDFTRLSGVMGACAFTDVDMCIEINRHLFVAEVKRGDTLPLGQRILLKRLAEIAGVTVGLIIVPHDAPAFTSQYMSAMYILGPNPYERELVATDEGEAMAYLRCWREMAEKNKSPLA